MIAFLKSLKPVSSQISQAWAGTKNQNKLPLEFSTDCISTKHKLSTFHTKQIIMGNLYYKVNAAFLEIQVHDHRAGIVLLFDCLKQK